MTAMDSSRKRCWQSCWCCGAALTIRCGDSGARHDLLAGCVGGTVVDAPPFRFGPTMLLLVQRELVALARQSPRFLAAHVDQCSVHLSRRVNQLQGNLARVVASTATTRKATRTGRN